MKIHHISDNDLDGVSALYLSKLSFDDGNFIRSTTRTIDSMVEKFVDNEWNKETLFVITDLSIESKELAEKIDKKVKDGYHMALIDHHPTAFWLNDYSWATVINEEDGVKTSATSMYLDYLIREHQFITTEIINDYVELVRAYDTWDWWYVGVKDKITGERVPNKRSKRLNDLLYIVGKDEFEKLVLQTLQTDKEEFEFNEKAEYLLDIEQLRIEEYIERKKEQLRKIKFSLDERTYQVAIVTAENYHSELGNVICQEDESIDFIAISDVSRRKISFRASKSDIDVSLVAKHFGGGGHAPSAGCSLNEETISIFLQPLL